MGGGLTLLSRQPRLGQQTLITDGIKGSIVIQLAPPTPPKQKQVLHSDMGIKPHQAQLYK